MQPLNSNLARRTVKNYRCSNCWGELEKKPDPAGTQDSYIVTCKKCCDETKGYVTEHYVKRMQSNSEFQKREVVRMLRKQNILPSEDRTATQILSEMGF